jgi:hypothetical protein
MADLPKRQGGRTGLQDKTAALLKGPLASDVYAEAKRRLAAAGSVPAR